MWGRRGNREQGTGNRNGGCRVDYEIEHALPATPFSNECSNGVYVAATGFSGIFRLILSRELMLWLGCTAPCAAFPVPCFLFPVPFALPLAIPPTPRQIRICMLLNCYRWFFNTGPGASIPGWRLCGCPCGRFGHDGGYPDAGSGLRTVDG